MSAWLHDTKGPTVWRIVLSISEVSGIGKGQAELIVAAKSRAAAARAFGCRDTELKSHGSETGNDLQIALAMAAVGTVFYKPLNDHTDNWKPRTPLSEQDAYRVTERGDHVKALAAARAKGKVVWVGFQFSQGAKLTLPGGISVVIERETGSRTDATTPGFKVRFAETTLVKRYADPIEARIAAVALARQKLTEALAALPEDPKLEE